MLTDLRPAENDPLQGRIREDGLADPDEATVDSQGFMHQRECNVLNRMTSFGASHHPDRLMPLPAGKRRWRNIRATKRLIAVSNSSTLRSTPHLSWRSVNGPKISRIGQDQCLCVG
jgi:hypothetical protein